MGGRLMDRIAITDVSGGSSTSAPTAASSATPTNVPSGTPSGPPSGPPSEPPSGPPFCIAHKHSDNRVKRLRLLTHGYTKMVGLFMRLMM